MKLNLCHLTTCTPDYFQGCSRPYLQVMVWRSMPVSALREALRTGLAHDHLQGSSHPLEEGDTYQDWLASDYTPDRHAKLVDMWYKAAHAAINRTRATKKGQRTLFKDLAKDVDGVYAYFYFEEA